MFLLQMEHAIGLSPKTVAGQLGQLSARCVITPETHLFDQDFEVFQTSHVSGNQSINRGELEAVAWTSLLFSANSTTIHRSLYRFAICCKDSGGH